MHSPPPFTRSNTSDYLYFSPIDKKADISYYDLKYLGTVTFCHDTKKERETVGYRES
jgi:hypothetical protein